MEASVDNLVDSTDSKESLVGTENSEKSLALLLTGLENSDSKEFANEDLSKSCACCLGSEPKLGACGVGEAVLKVPKFEPNPPELKPELKVLN